eukprot:CAMPEP_0179123702 /NCGR_PEP_ID=MMETSP0796-20121207/58429_1 /TAXON_ID=73915 /ORGANISM="Pyrodinium bahamense, Strain pbaha01" /LENGTH=511 /DNA_ID=CAMNT_0020822347 /DNA_START=134 /DNA_END=1669 /DNA_ORIENTATION=-
MLVLWAFFVVVSVASAANQARPGLAAHPLELEAEAGVEEEEEEDEEEETAFLQRGTEVLFPRVNSTQDPYLIPLRRELSPVIRKGKVISHRASYSGIIHVGQPHPQEFRVVFDTGSAHVVLPSIECHSTACLKHMRYDVLASQTGEAIHLDGRRVLPGHVGEGVTIGFGTAKVTGNFVRDQICMGPAKSSALPRGPCVRSQAVVATEMSSRPFEQFKFDGIVGLGLPTLALNANFSLFNELVVSGQLAFPYFSFFLAEGDDGEESEIAIGGQNPKHLLEPISWVPMAKPELGYWQVQITAVHINGAKMDICDAGDCHGILDSGTSHFGIPSTASDSLNDMLTMPAGEARDCRWVEAPVVLLELNGLNLTLYPENYMRLLPVPGDVLNDANVTLSPNTVMQDSTQEEDAQASGNSTDAPNDLVPADLLCTPKLLPVSWPEPVGPNVFILGEPVLQRYYTVFDWVGQRAGFGLASHLRAPRREVKASALPRSTLVQDEIVMIQLVVSVRVSRV